MQNNKKNIHIYYFIQTVLQKILQKRFIVLCGIILFTEYVYLRPVISVCKITDEKVTPWILVFLFSNIYFIMILFMGAMYLFGNIPFFHQWTIYHIIRMRKKRWIKNQIFALVIQNFFYCLWIYISGIFILFPYLKWSLDWGKVINTLALSESELTEKVLFSISDRIIYAYKPANILGINFFYMFFLIFFLGNFMYFFSLFSSRMIAISISMFLITLVIMGKNMFFFKTYLWYSPFSWMDLNILLDHMGKNNPPILYTMMFLSIFNFIFILLVLKKVENIDFQWNREEI